MSNTYNGCFHKILKQYNLKIGEHPPFYIINGLLSKILSEELSVKLTIINHIKIGPFFENMEII